MSGPAYFGVINTWAFFGFDDPSSRVNLYFMGRRWLDVSRRDYLRMPHAEAVPESIWWYGTNRADNAAVIDSYLARYARGKKVPEGFRESLVTCLNYLTRRNSLASWNKPKTKRYWTIPNYARAKGLRPFTLMKWMRELEKTAKEMFPERAATHGRRLEPLTDAEISSIRAKYRAGAGPEEIAREFKIAEGYVGRLCRSEQKRRRAAREARRAAPASVGFEDPDF